MPLTDEEVADLDPIAPPFYSGPELARIREKAKKLEEAGLTADVETRVADDAERIAWARAKYQKLRSPSKSMREFARQEVLTRVFDETHKKKRDYA